MKNYLNSNYKDFAKDLMYKKKIYSLAIIFSILSIGTSAISPLLFSKLVDDGILASDKYAIIELLIITMIVTIIGAGATYFTNILFGRLRRYFVLRVKEKVLNRVSLFDGSQMSDMNNGLLINVLNRDIEEIGFTMTERVFNIISDFITALVSLSVMLFIDIRLTIMSILIQTTLIYINNCVTKKIRKVYDEMRIVSDELLEKEEEYINNLQTIIQSDICDYFIKKIYKKEDVRQYKIYTTNKYEAINISISTILNFVAMATIWLIGGFSVIDGVITYGLLTAYSSYSAKLFSPIIRLIEANVEVQKLRAAINRVYNILNLPRKDGLYCDNKYPFSSDIVFNKVSFRYNEKADVFFENSFVIKKNKLNIFIGESGQGKSTLTYLLTKFWEVSAGEILINNENIINYKSSVLRNNIAYISQSPLILKDTVKNNLCLGKEIDEQEILESLEKVNMIDYVLSLNNGLNYMIDVNGRNLSGGQRKRLTIARSLLREANMYIFDEPTSGLDPLNKEIIYNIINEHLTEKTIVLITHDIDILEKVDSATINMINKCNVTQVKVD